MTTAELLQRTQKAKREFLLTTGQKNAALLSMAEQIEAEAEAILAANAQDVAAHSQALGPVMTDRLLLTRERLKGMADGIRAVAALPDPVGRVLEETTLPNGLLLKKVSVPLGVVAVIYESRPNVTSDAAALAIKSGNVAVLRSGKEAFGSVKAIVAAMKRGLQKAGVCPDCIAQIEDPSRESARELMTATGYVDLLIPRGGKGLIASCVANATVPCLETGTGICHLYVDRSADFDKALSVVENAKTSRPSVCNAAEVLLVHRAIADAFLPLLKKRLVDDRLAAGKPPVELRSDAEAHAVLGGIAAGKDDFDTEFLDYVLAVKVVADVDEAIAHIAEHSTHHSEAILTEDAAAAERFCERIDSAAVYVNASTRFTDGGEFGLGCEIGISTQKLHARGPVGLRELTTYQYRVFGNGQIR